MKPAYQDHQIMEPVTHFERNKIGRMKRKARFMNSNSNLNGSDILHGVAEETSEVST